MTNEGPTAALGAGCGGSGRARALDDAAHSSRHAAEHDMQRGALDHSWTGERLIEWVVSGLALGAIVLAVVSDRHWLWCAGALLAFVFCGGAAAGARGMGMLRRLGWRTDGDFSGEGEALPFLRDADGASSRFPRESSGEGMHA
ncbi:hypothetical protein K0B96_09345 [Horticoccus luteus]|uniref:Uncharacterized protein n=1 Tax=Horticoccus luteus TaxID=2862869 RepID=A0A8F9TSZ7_9BACT|nr:hypothetical protein [Horticoccus luteus]QYM77532.1 hypothetical protein K0B96_09345 [Horticoccus luteus]